MPRGARSYPVSRLEEHALSGARPLLQRSRTPVSTCAPSSCEITLVACPQFEPKASGRDRKPVPDYCNSRVSLGKPRVLEEVPHRTAPTLSERLGTFARRF